MGQAQRTYSMRAVGTGLTHFGEIEAARRPPYLEFELPRAVAGPSSARLRMDLPNSASEARTARLAALEDEIRRRLWVRVQEHSGPDLDRMVAELARDQYASETGLH